MSSSCVCMATTMVSCIFCFGLRTFVYNNVTVWFDCLQTNCAEHHNSTILCSRSCSRQVSLALQSKLPTMCQTSQIPKNVVTVTWSQEYASQSYISAQLSRCPLPINCVYSLVYYWAWYPILYTQAFHELDNHHDMYLSIDTLAQVTTDSRVWSMSCHDLSSSRA